MLIPEDGCTTARRNVGNCQTARGNVREDLNLQEPCIWFLGALRKIAMSDYYLRCVCTSVCMSICLSAYPFARDSWAVIGRIFTKFDT